MRKTEVNIPEIVVPRVTKCGIGVRLKQLRSNRNLTAEYVARAIKLPTRFIRTVERGRMMPTAAELVALAVVCRTSVDYLLIGQSATLHCSNDRSRRSRTLPTRPIEQRTPAAGEWVTVREAARLSGVSVSNWYARAIRVAEYAMRTGIKSLAVHAPISRNGSRRVWWLHRSLDERLRLDFDAQFRLDQSRKFPCSKAQLERGRRRAKWAAEWRKACDAQAKGKRNTIALAKRTVRRAKRAEGSGFKISVRSLQGWWRRYAGLGPNGGIAGVKGLI